MSRTRRKLKRAALMLNLFTLPRLPWVSDGEDKVELSAAELESLRSELSELAEREAYLKAHVGQLCLVNHFQVDDWLPRFVVLQGPCLFFYFLSTDLSPQDSTLVPDIVEVGTLSSYTREFDESHHCFYILTRQGLRVECSSTSKTQVNSWLSGLRHDCMSEQEKRLQNGSSQSA
uniref:PH domain-containing protein n=1 Tax=Brassica oleracea var. oleracea TaxID=109376 RepID=A0A0D3BK23_BRAOL